MAPINFSSVVLEKLASPGVLIVTSILVSLAYLAYERLLSPLAGVPGPFSSSLSRWWMVRHSLAGDMHRTMIELHQKHGDYVRTGPNELSVADLTAVKKIYGAGSQFRKSDWYSVFQGARKFDIFPERDEKVHSAQRRLVARVYAMDTLRDLEPYVNNATSVFMQRMETLHEQTIDMGSWLQLYAFGMNYPQGTQVER